MLVEHGPRTAVEYRYDDEEIIDARTPAPLPYVQMASFDHLDIAVVQEEGNGAYLGDQDPCL